MRIYISGPMAGDDGYMEKFRKVADSLLAGGYDIVNPAMLDSMVTGLEYCDKMALDLTMIDYCDAIVMMPGWEDSPGCTREYGYAMARDMLIFGVGDLCK